MKITTTLMASAALACMIAACDGPKEKAGAARDEAAANASGVPYNGNGPAEEAGRAADRIDRAAEKARDSQADALKEQSHVIEAQADAEADNLEQRAKELREKAEADARSLDQQAEAIKQKH